MSVHSTHRISVIFAVFLFMLPIEPSKLLLVSARPHVMCCSIPAFAIVCYKCRSVNNNNYACSDPFDEQRQVERRECPAYERCAKITGINHNGQYFVIRDCYRTNFDARQQTYREKRIQYYQVFLKVRDCSPCCVD